MWRTPIFAVYISRASVFLVENLFSRLQFLCLLWVKTYLTILSKIIEIELKEKKLADQKVLCWLYLMLKIISNFVSVRVNCLKSMDNHAYVLTKQTKQTKQVMSVIHVFVWNIMQNYKKKIFKKNDYDPSWQNLFYKITCKS